MEISPSDLNFAFGASGMDSPRRVSTRLSLSCLAPAIVPRWLRCRWEEEEEGGTLEMLRWLFLCKVDEDGEEDLAAADRLGLDLLRCAGRRLLFLAAAASGFRLEVRGEFLAPPGDALLALMPTPLTLLDG